MIGNMLNDLAEAIRRWTEKKTLQIHLRANPLAGPEGRVRLSKIPRRTKSEQPLMVNRGGGS